MRKPKCAEPVAIEAQGHVTAYAACRREVPCPDHPAGKIDTIRDAVKEQAKWKRDARRARTR